MAADGRAVYAGGTFTSIGGQPRTAIAALDVASGAVTAFDPNPTGDFPWVVALAVSGSTVYAAGEFTGIGGQPRTQIAALDATSGAATVWNPNVNGVFAIEYQHPPSSGP